MSSPLTVQDLLERHKADQHNHQPIPTFAEILSQGASMPRILIITCADPRCIPENIFKLKTGEAVVVRNAGGNAEFALNPILSIDSLVSFTDILIVKHTDCGATMFRDANIKKGLNQRAPGLQDAVDTMTFGEITESLEESVTRNINFLRRTPFIRSELKDRISGFVYDLKTGDIKEVKV